MNFSNALRLLLYAPRGRQDTKSGRNFKPIIPIGYESAQSGNALTFHFCPTCGSTVYWEGEGFPGYVAVAIGNFADPNFPAPTIAVWEESRHPWVSLPPDTPPKRVAKQG